MAKYDPLRAYLESTTGPIALTFDEIGRQVGGLPPSAYRWRAWWANDRSHVHARAWLDVGRRVDSVDLQVERVTFDDHPTR